MHTILPLLLAWHANAAIQLGYESAKRVQYLSCPLPSSSFSSLLSLTRGTHLYVVFNLRPTALLQYTGQYPCLSSPSSARPGRRAQDFRRPSIWTPIVADHRFSCGHRACSEGPFGSPISPRDPPVFPGPHPHVIFSPGLNPLVIWQPTNPGRRNPNLPFSPCRPFPTSRLVTAPPRLFLATRCLRHARLLPVHSATCAAAPPPASPLHHPRRLVPFTTSPPLPVCDAFSRFASQTKRRRPSVRHPEIVLFRVPRPQPTSRHRFDVLRQIRVAQGRRAATTSDPAWTSRWALERLPNLCTPSPRSLVNASCRPARQPIQEAVSHNARKLVVPAPPLILKAIDQFLSSFVSFFKVLVLLFTIDFCPNSQ